VSDAFFVPLGDGRFRATERTSGPWDPRHQHAGPPSALLTGLLERTAPRDDTVLARVTVEILGAVPIEEVEASTTVERPGRSVELLAGELRAGGRAVLRARAWRVLASPVGTPLSEPVALPDKASVPPPLRGETFGYAHAIEWRWARGDWAERGPAAAWTRMGIPVVEGEEPTPRQRVMVVADSGNGASNVLDWSRYLFINTELTVHFLREPVGEWVLLDARTEIAEGGAGLATSVLSDRSGPVARGAQALLVAPRSQ
jgi:acyl-Coa thioesterase superfamily protein/acyl-CoA thioesterase superfamily protein